ncbi:cell wall metabolism sensor histidine kinase WalK [Pseudonocardia sp. N23]|uniref:sensor histidine kinase n=1 Tax=Pseudonocardia sp. N23 TaxID=1987376 RepID=UPI000BFCA594|nr:HAMP domain-containing sensor histidine kinase [Pseudonocardia sp. N23]GAY08356.1 two-component sensor [Pseudonocardia sp. N23]
MSRTGPTGEAVLARRAAVRLGVQAAVLAGLIVVALTAVAVAVLLGAQRSEVAAQLQHAIDRADDVADPPSGMYLVLREQTGEITTSPGLHDGVADLRAVAEAAAGGAPPTVERNVDEVQYEIATELRDDGVTVQAILDLTANHSARNRLLATMFATGIAGLFVAGAAGTWLGHRALTPLSAALSLQRRFVADAGHELRTPLTLIDTRAQLLRRRLRRDPHADPALLAEVEGVVADTGRLTAILEDLLLAADPLGVRPREPVDLTGLCRGVLAAAAADAADHQIDLRLDAAGPVYVLGSAAALRRAVTALADNAVRHAGRVVTVAVRDDHGTAVVEVADDGAGVDPALAPRLFDRFATASRPADPGRRRYGLGLAIVAEIASAHGGRVALVTPGPDPAGATARGAAFRLTFPTATDPGADEAVPEPGAPRNL